MFFGKMQSFYKRNSIHNQTSTQTSKPKDTVKRIKHINKYDDDEHQTNGPIRRRSFSISRPECYEEPTQNANVPIIQIGLYEPETSKKSNNILKEKEKALWYNTGASTDDNRERLGPNKNNIIEATLEIERRKSADWGH